MSSSCSHPTFAPATPIGSRTSTSLPCNARCGHQQAKSQYQLRCSTTYSVFHAPSIGSPRSSHRPLRNTWRANWTLLATSASAIGCAEDELADSSVRYERLMSWLFGDRDHRDHPVSGFLFKLDEFNLNDYIKAIHFDDLKVPSAPFQIPNSKTYFGLDQMMESELDFLKATVLSKSTEP